MLVLSRKKGERIHIGDDIFITLIEIRGDKARIGIEAPDNLAIHREEVILRIAEGEKERTAKQ